MALTVPIPVLTQEGSTGPRFKADKPIQLSCGPITFPDGTTLTIENAAKFGFLLFRERTAGTVEVWDEEARSWRPQSPPPVPQPLFFKDGSWQSVIVAVGQKDHANRNKVGTDPLTGLPNYFVRCFFVGKDAQGAEHTGESPNSQAVEIVNTSEQKRAGLGMDPMDPANAREIGLFLKDAALTAEKGKVRIREEAGGYLIELEASGATLTITQDGQITLRPRSGQPVRVEGNVQISGNVTASNIP